MVGHSLDQGAALPLYLHYRLLPRATMGAEGQVDAQEEGPVVRGKNKYDLACALLALLAVRVTLVVPVALWIFSDI